MRHYLLPEFRRRAVWLRTGHVTDLSAFPTQFQRHFIREYAAFQPDPRNISPLNVEYHSLIDRIDTYNAPCDNRCDIDETLAEMDWTGGVRRRFAPGKKNGTIQKQKAHFAKARAALNNTPSSQYAFRPSSLQTAAHSAETRLDQPHGSVRSEYANHEKRTTNTLLQGMSSHRSRDKKHRSGANNTTPAMHHNVQGGSHSPSAVYVGSRDISSSPGPSVPQQRTELHRKSNNLSAHKTSGITEEERLLFANRQRLLGRTDWLGLAATRPVKMSFKTSNDKDRIGQRREIASSASRKGRPADQRALTPLFEDRLLQRDDTMSGALQYDDFQVKVGTDALGSQTHRSRHSYTPGKTSPRQPSTEFGPLSEESMLLDAEVDLSETLHSPTVPTRIADGISHTAESLAVLAGSQMTRNVQHLPESPEMRLLPSEPKIYQPLDPEKVQDPEFQAVEAADGVPQLDAFPIWQASQPADQPSTLVPRYNNNHSSHVPTNRVRAEDHTQLPTVVTRTEYTDDDDDEAWRQILNIRQCTSSHHSMAAVKSSSLHLTRSERSVRPVLDVLEEPIDGHRSPLSTLKSAGTQSSIPIRAQPTTNEPDSASQSVEIQSPSASLQQIKRFAEQPAEPVRRVDEEVDDNALWRQFIIGSQDSSDEPSQFNYTAPVRDDEVDDTALHAPGSSSAVVSVLGTSNKSTLGDTLFVTGSTFSTMSQTPASRRLELASDQHRHSATSHASMVAHAETRDRDQDSIEDHEPASEKSDKPRNLHASKAATLNPRRFKPPLKRTAPPLEKPNQLLPSRKARTYGVSNVRSVYDLLESDDASAA